MFWLEGFVAIRLTGSGPRGCRLQQGKFWLMKKELPPIHSIRRQRVMLDSDLARLYGVPTFRLNEAVKRNAARFPSDFRFQLTREEYANLISQIVITSSETADAEDDVPRSSQIAMTSSRRFRAQA